jgi:hypothetical protein
MTKEIKGVKMKSLNKIGSNSGFLQFYNPPLPPPSSQAPVNFSGRRADVGATATVAVEE